MNKSLLFLKSQFTRPLGDYRMWLGRCVRMADVVPVSPWRSVYVVNDPDIIQAICQSDGKHTSKDAIHYQRFANTMGAGVLTNSGAAWQASRDRCGKAFWPDRVVSCDAIINRHLHRWHQDCLHQATQHAVVDVYHDVSWRLFALNCELLFNVVLLPEEARHWFDVMTRLSDHAMVYGWSPQRWRGHKRFRAMQAALDDWLWGMRLNMVASNALLAKLAQASLVDSITRSQYLGEVKNILFASYDTTMTAMSWGLHALAMHQGVQQSLRRRLRSHVHLQSESGLTIYQQCEPIRNLIAEVLRLYPSVFALERRLVEVPESLRGRFRPNAVILFSPYWLHRHPRYWQHPEAFYPDRFKKPLAHRYAYIPFMLGARTCMGQHLSNAVMAKFFLTMLSDIHYLPSGKAPTMLSCLTLRAKSGIHLQLKPCFVRHYVAPTSPRVKNGIDKYAYPS